LIRRMTWFEVPQENHSRWEMLGRRDACRHSSVTASNFFRPECEGKPAKGQSASTG
jgi:hypothetical protein